MEVSAEPPRRTHARRNPCSVTRHSPASLPGTRLPEGEGQPACRHPAPQSLHGMPTCGGEGKREHQFLKPEKRHSRVQSIQTQSHSCPRSGISKSPSQARSPFHSEELGEAALGKASYRDTSQCMRGSQALCF